MTQGRVWVWLPLVAAEPEKIEEEGKEGHEGGSTCACHEGHEGHEEVGGLEDEGAVLVSIHASQGFSS